MLKRASEGPLPAAGLPDRPHNVMGGFDLLKYVGLIRRRGPVIAVFAVLGGVLGAIYALQLTAVYTATATLMLDSSPNSMMPTDPSYVAYLDDGRIESELAIIGSTSVAKRVAQKLKLDDAAPAPESPSISQTLFSHLKSLLGGSEPAVKEPDPVVADDAFERTARALQGAIQVRRRGFSYLINVSYTSPNPDQAAAIANAFADEYLVDQLETRYEDTKRTNDWLNERLGDLRE